MVRHALPLLFSSVCLLAQTPEASPAPAPAPAAQATAPAPAPPPVTAAAAAPAADGTALKAQLEDLLNRVRQLQEDGVLRRAELKAAQAELAAKVTALEALPVQVKAAGDQAKAAVDQVAALDRQDAQARLARLEGERAALQMALTGLAGTRKALRAPGPLVNLEQALTQLQEATALNHQPAFNALLATVKDKLAKGPLGSPLRDPAVMSNFFANPFLGSDWVVASVPYGPGWESDKLKNMQQGLDAVDGATRMAVELKTGQAQIAGLKAEALQLELASDELLTRVLGLLDPAGTPEPEVLAAKAEAAYKPLLDALAKGPLPAANRAALVALIGARNDVQALTLTEQLLLQRMLGTTSSLAVTFGRFRQEAPGKDLPALDALLKAAEATRPLLKAPAPSSLAIAQLEAAGY